MMRIEASASRRLQRISEHARRRGERLRPGSIRFEFAGACREGLPSDSQIVLSGQFRYNNDTLAKVPEEALCQDFGMLQDMSVQLNI
jgi:hypothetical protein